MTILDRLRRRAAGGVLKRHGLPFSTTELQASLAESLGLVDAFNRLYMVEMTEDEIHDILANFSAEGLERFVEDIIETADEWSDPLDVYIARTFMACARGEPLPQPPSSSSAGSIIPELRALHATRQADETAAILGNHLPQLHEIAADVRSRFHAPGSRDERRARREIEAIADRLAGRKATTQDPFLRLRVARNALFGYLMSEAGYSVADDD